MTISRRTLLGSAAGAIALPATRARAQSRPKIRILVMTDLSGTYRDNTGPTSVAASQIAMDEVMAGGRDFDVEITSVDHQNKPDIGAALARQALDSGVDVIADVPTSSVALAVAQVCHEKDRIHLNASATVASLTGEQCQPTTIVWSFDTYSNAKSTGGAMVKNGGDSWFFITADYAFGHSLEDLTRSFVEKGGGKSLGAIRYPFPDTTDFSAFLQQAAASGAKVLGTESFYWDLNEGTRRFTKKVIARTPANYPNQAQASSYSSVLHYLKTVSAMGAAEAKKSGAATVARMKAMPTEDDAFGKGSVGANGRGVFPAYLFEVKKPEEVKYPWDYYKLVATTPGPEAVRPLAETGCKFIRS